MRYLGTPLLARRCLALFTLHATAGEVLLTQNERQGLDYTGRCWHTV